MFLKILQHTPLWVFILFFVLLAMGLFQTRDRIIKQKTIFIFPSSMVLLSFYGVVSAFGFTYRPFFYWLFSLFFAIVLGLAIALPKKVIYLKSSHSFNIPGSWVPLSLIMGIFFIKYAVGVAFARQLPVVQNGSFIITICSLYGFFSGLFFSRGLVIRKSVQKVQT